MTTVWHKAASLLSFPRRRESSNAAAFLDPCLRRGDKLALHAALVMRGSNDREGINES